MLIHLYSHIDNDLSYQQIAISSLELEETSRKYYIQIAWQIIVDKHNLRSVLDLTSLKSSTVSATS